MFGGSPARLGQTASEDVPGAFTRGAAAAGTTEPVGRRPAQGGVRRDDPGSVEATDLFQGLLALGVRTGLPR